MIPLLYEMEQSMDFSYSERALPADPQGYMQVVSYSMQPIKSKEIHTVTSDT